MDDLFTRMEFSVQMKCESCAAKVRSKLENVAGISNVTISVPNDLVLLDSNLTTSEVHSLLESTGLLVFFKGFGGEDGFSKDETQAAVSIIKGEGGKQMGLVRMVQAAPSRCVIEVAFTKLPAGEYFVCIHEFGDLSQGGRSCGEVYYLSDEVPPIGNLGRVMASETDTSELHVVSENIKVSEVIGRSIVISSIGGERIMCGVIARSSGLFQNPKKICTCDGITIWDEARRQK